MMASDVDMLEKRLSDGQESCQREMVFPPLVLPNDVQTIPQLAQYVDEICEAVGFDHSLVMQMNLALEEAVVNVMNYAYPADVGGDLRVDAQCSRGQLIFIITDKGIPFDPTEKEMADTTLSAEERPIGGLGIFLVDQLMDSVVYQRVDGMNVLTLSKKLDSTKR